MVKFNKLLVNAHSSERLEVARIILPILVLAAVVETLATVISVAVLCIMAAPTLEYMDYIDRFAIVFTFAEYVAVFSSRFDRTKGMPRRSGCKE